MADAGSSNDAVQVATSSAPTMIDSVQPAAAADSMAAASVPAGAYGSAPAQPALAQYAPPTNNGGYSDYPQGQSAQGADFGDQNPAPKLFIGQLSRSMTDEQVCCWGFTVKPLVLV